jgi:hypothetical protein
MTVMVEGDILRHVLGGADGEGGAVPETAVSCFPVMSVRDWGAVGFGFVSRRVLFGGRKRKGWGTRSRKADS